jgi:SAM-dependent methyltransferase
MPLAGAMAEAAERCFSRQLEAAYAQVDLLALHFCFHLVHRFGLFDGGSVFTFDGLVRRIGVAPEAEFLLRTVLDMLREEGYVASQGEAWRVCRPCPEDETAKLQKQAREQCPDTSPLFECMERCHDHAASFITGEETGLDVLFPRGDMQLWEQMYREAMVLAFYNDLITPALAQILDREGARILEVGAGVGGVLQRVLPLLRERNIQEYRFTDLGKFFVRRMERAHGRESFLKFAIVNLDLPLAEQGVEPASLDAIVGVNVVHAAREIEFSLRELRAALREGGHLLLSEGSPPQRGLRSRLEVVVGFLRGWWDVTLTQYRPRPGFLLPSEWLELLRVCGYQGAVAVPGEDWFQGPCRGGLLMARK